MVDGVNVDAAAAAVAACTGVSGLDGGRYHEVATYLPGRTVDGVAIGGGRGGGQVRAAWGVAIPPRGLRIRGGRAPLTGTRPVDVLVADVGDPPGQVPPDLPGPMTPAGPTPPGSAHRPESSSGLPPG